jgi:hypothetical protein
MSSIESEISTKSSFLQKNRGMHVSTSHNIDNGKGDLVCELEVKHRSSLSNNDDNTTYHC